MLAICEEAHRRGEGTRWKNTHPIAILFLLKLSELAGCGSTLDPSYTDAMIVCSRIANENGSEGEAEEAERQSWETPSQKKARLGS
jgi:hypothetical protein